MSGKAKGENGMADKEALARALWASGALSPGPGDRPLVWNGGAALNNEDLRAALLDALEELARDHYAAARAVLGGPWAEALARRLELPLNPRVLPDRILAVEEVVSDGEELLALARPIRAAGASIAAAALFNFGLESARRRLDLADVRLHWLTDLETAAAVALQDGLLDFDDYDRLMAYQGSDGQD